MPISANPNKIGFYFLECDAEIPLETRPLFLMRYLTMAQQDDVNDRAEEARKIPDAKERRQAYLNIIKTGVVGWKNFLAADGSAIEFNDANIVARLTYRELRELIWQLGSPLSEQDLKNFESQRSSAAAGSAAAARVAAA